MKYLDTLINSYIKLYKSEEGIKKLNQSHIYVDNYKIKSIDFIKSEVSLDFLWTLEEIHIIRESLKGIKDDIDLGIYRQLIDLQLESISYANSVNLVEKINLHYPLFSSQSFGSNLYGLIIFFQQLFRIFFARQKEKTARYFVQAHPELISHYIQNPDSLQFIGKEITLHDSKTKNQASSVRIIEGQALIIYPKYTSPNKIRSEIKRRIKLYGIRNFVDITSELLLLETNNTILIRYKNILANKQKAKLVLPSNCNPYILVQVMNEIIHGHGKRKTS